MYNLNYHDIFGNTKIDSDMSLSNLLHSYKNGVFDKNFVMKVIYNSLIIFDNSSLTGILDITCDRDILNIIYNNKFIDTITDDFLLIAISKNCYHVVYDIINHNKFKKIYENHILKAISLTVHINIIKLLTEKFPEELNILISLRIVGNRKFLEYRKMTPLQHLLFNRLSDDLDDDRKDELSKKYKYYKSIVYLFINCPKIDINVKDSIGCTALDYLYTIRSHHKLCNYIIKNRRLNLDFNIHGEYITPLKQLLNYADEKNPQVIEYIKYIVTCNRFKINFNNRHHYSGNTLLSNFFNIKHLREVVTYMLESNRFELDFNIKNDHNRTPFYYFCMNYIEINNIADSKEHIINTVKKYNVDLNICLCKEDIKKIYTKLGLILCTADKLYDLLLAIFESEYISELAIKHYNNNYSNIFIHSIKNNYIYENILHISNIISSYSYYSRLCDIIEYCPNIQIIYNFIDYICTKYIDRIKSDYLNGEYDNTVIDNILINEKLIHNQKRLIMKIYNYSKDFLRFNIDNIYNIKDIKLIKFMINHTQYSISDFDVTKFNFDDNIILEIFEFIVNTQFRKYNNTKQINYRDKICDKLVTEQKIYKLCFDFKHRKKICDNKLILFYNKIIDKLLITKYVQPLLLLNYKIPLPNEILMYILSILRCI